MTKFLQRWFGSGLVGALLATGVLGAAAQQPVVTQPYAGTAAQTTGTIVSTNTFQIVLAYNGLRKNGVVQNTGTAFMYLYLAARGTDCTAATEAKSFQLQPPTSTSQGGSFNLASGVTALPDEVCIAGTSGDSYVYFQQ